MSIYLFTFGSIVDPIDNIPCKKIKREYPNEVPYHLEIDYIDILHVISKFDKTHFDESHKVSYLTKLFLLKIHIKSHVSPHSIELAYHLC